MYLQFFGLTEAPFSITPDPAFVYLSDEHHDSDTCKAARRMLDMAGVKYDAFVPETTQVVIDFGQAVGAVTAGKVRA